MTEGVSNNQNINNIPFYPVENVTEYTVIEGEDLPPVFESELEGKLDKPGDEFTPAENEAPETSETQTKELESELKSAEDEQGWLGNAWNSFKGFVGIGTSTKKCNQAIDDFKNGKISYNEAKNEISEFSSSQKESVEVISNVISGTAAVGAAVAATAMVAATGPIAPFLLAGIGIGTGAVTKAGLTFSDRATNNIDDDALNEKQIIEDLATGGVDGGISVATMGMGTVASAASSTLKSAVVQGFKSGIGAGTLAGGLSGGSNYAIKTALDDNAEFTKEEFAENILTNAIAGGITGGGLGIIGGKVQHENYLKLDNNSKELFETCESHIDEAKEQVGKLFNDLIENKSIEFSGRAKSEDSILKKLLRKFDNNRFMSTDKDESIKAVGDAYGTRIQMKSLTEDEANGIINQGLDGYENIVSRENFISYIKGDKSNLSQLQIDTLDNIHGDILDALKEKQSKEVVNILKTAIRDKKLTITELNNYGDELSSYFTGKQLREISEAYMNAADEGLTLVTKEDIVRNATGVKVPKSGNSKDYEKTLSESKFVKELDTEKAVKKSGYTSTQMNTIHTFEDGTTGNGELQIRGKSVNKLADVEHIPYDIRQGKITAEDKEYSKIFSIIDDMDKKTFNKYNQFLTDTYHSMRLKELGIPTEIPDIRNVFKQGEIPDEAFDILSVDGLVKTAKEAKEYRKQFKELNK